jgi:hypothetical protein
VPGHRRAPVVARDHRRRGPEGIEEPYQIADQVEQAVALDLGGGVGLAVAAHVGRHRAEARVGQRAELMTPRIPGFREAVTQEHDRASALLGHVHANPIGLDDAMLDLAHPVSLTRRAAPRGTGPSSGRKSRRSTRPRG